MGAQTYVGKTFERRQKKPLAIHATRGTEEALNPKLADESVQLDHGAGCDEDKM